LLTAVAFFGVHIFALGAIGRVPGLHLDRQSLRGFEGGVEHYRKFGHGSILRYFSAIFPQNGNAEGGFTDSKGVKGDLVYTSDNSESIVNSLKINDLSHLHILEELEISAKSFRNGLNLAWFSAIFPQNSAQFPGGFVGLRLWGAEKP
jgi:hypothetical protein